MKPDWKDAPIWARWLAMDALGAWYWHEKEPFADLRTREWSSNGNIRLAEGPHWTSLREERPND